jgi:hypothetical protein
MAVLSIPTSFAGVSLPGLLGSIASGPLSALFGGKGINSLKYPPDLATSPSKNHYVSFSIKEVVPADYAAQTDVQPGTSISVRNAAELVSQGGIAAAEGLKSAATSAAGSAIPGATTVSEGLSGTATGIEIASKWTSKAFAKGLTISPQTKTLTDVISLYMPDSLEATYNASWEEMSLSALGPTLTSLRAIDQIAGANKGGDFSSVGAAIKTVGNSGNYASSSPEVTLLATNLASGLGLDSKAGIDAGKLQQVLLKGQGYALNPQVQFIFNQVDFRSFSLSFIFTPKSQQEADTVNKIIATFKRHFAPKFQQGKSTSNESMFLIPPSTFELKFKIGQKENTYIPKYGECVLENMSVNYTPNGFAVYSTGVPVQTQLSLSFKEIVIVDRDSLDQGKLR